MDFIFNRNIKLNIIFKIIVFMFFFGFSCPNFSNKPFIILTTSTSDLVLIDRIYHSTFCFKIYSLFDICIYLSCCDFHVYNQLLSCLVYVYDIKNTMSSMICSLALFLPPRQKSLTLFGSTLLPFVLRSLTIILLWYMIISRHLLYIFE